MMMALGVDYVVYYVLARWRIIAKGKTSILIRVLDSTGQMTAHKIGLNR